jgi:arylsulfatase A-like enzyme
VIGASDNYGATPIDRPVSVADFAATVYHALGLDPKAEFATQGRRIKMLPEGSFIKELF